MFDKEELVFDVVCCEKSNNDDGVDEQENAEIALVMCRLEPLVLSGGKDKPVILWIIQDHVSSLSNASAAKSPGSASSTGKRLAKTNYEKNSDSPKIEPSCVFQGHQDTVEEVQLSPSSAQELCSADDGSCPILWDARVGTSPVIKVKKAHDSDLRFVDGNCHDENLIVTGSADTYVRLFDRCKLSFGAVGSPLYIFQGPGAAVLCVQWCPDEASIFDSDAEDSFLNVWDQDKVGKKQGRAGTMVPKSPPGLFFQRTGHRDEVVDLNWNTEDPWIIVSVSDDCEITSGVETCVLKPGRVVTFGPSGLTIAAKSVEKLSLSGGNTMQCRRHFQVTMWASMSRGCGSFTLVGKLSRMRTASRSMTKLKFQILILEEVVKDKKSKETHDKIEISNFDLRGGLHRKTDKFSGMELPSIQYTEFEPRL